MFQVFNRFTTWFHWDQKLEHEKILGLHDNCCFEFLLLCRCHFSPYSSFEMDFVMKKNLLMLDYDIFFDFYSCLMCFICMYTVLMKLRWFDAPITISLSSHFFCLFFFSNCVWYRSFSIFRVICDVCLMVWYCTSVFSTSLRRPSDSPCVDYYRALYVMFPSVVTRANRLGSVISWKYAIKTNKSQCLTAGCLRMTGTKNTWKLSKILLVFKNVFCWKYIAMITVFAEINAPGI